MNIELDRPLSKSEWMALDAACLKAQAMLVSLKMKEEQGMYERFTDRARRVKQLANQEAQRLNHEYIGTEHILLGLVKEGSGVACNVLKNLNVDLGRIRIEVEKIVQLGPNVVTMGKLPLTPNVKGIIDLAIKEATMLSHSYVGTEHLLLGMLLINDGVACRVLTEMGLGLNQVREAVLELLAPEPKQPPTLAEIEEQISNLTIQGSQMLKAFNDAMCNAHKVFCKRFTELHAQLTEMKQVMMFTKIGDVEVGPPEATGFAGPISGSKEAAVKVNEPHLPQPSTSWRDQPPML
jgi:Clp amino terminal domain, pathogenicity island component